MTLTQITEKGIKDGEIINADINASAAIAKSKIETFVNNNSNNRVITGSNTTNSLEGEANLTYNGQLLQATNSHINIDSGYSYQWGDSHERIEQSDGKIEFFTNNGEQMTISGGSVGIGNTAPAHKFEVLNGADHQNIIVAKGADTSTEYAGMGVHGGNAIFTGGGAGSTSAGMIFRTAASGTETERMRIDSDGKVYVGGNGASATAGQLWFNDTSAYSSKIAQVNGSSALSFHTGSSQPERLRLNNVGQLIIGATSTNDSSEMFLVAGAASNNHCGLGIKTNNNVHDGIIAFHDSDANYRGSLRYDHSVDAMFFNTSGSERMRIDSSGVVGIGVTPKTGQYSGYNHLQVGESATLSSNDTQGDTNVTNLTNNVYLNSNASAWKYLHTDEASRYQQYNGGHFFAVASSGSADATASFSNKVRIDTDGLKFGSDTAAANALNDYEEGTWTPQLIRNGQNSYASLGSGNRYGYYKKVGKIIFLSFYWYNPSLTDSAGQYWIIQNMPYTLKQGNAGAYQFLPGGYYYMNGNNVGDHASNGSYRWQSNSNGLVLYSASNNMNANGAVEFSGCGALCVA